MISVKLPIGESPGMNTVVCSLHSNQTRGGLRQPRYFELVDLGPELARRDDDRLAQIVRRHVPDELTGALDVDDRVFFAPVEVCVARRHHVRRVERGVIELTEGSEVRDAVNRECREPADRPGHDARLERIEGQAVM
jgi:hypothetical protein